MSATGLLPIMGLVERAGLRSMSNQWLSVSTDKGANASKKVSSLVGGMVAGADSIDDMALLRHGGMKRIFTSCYAPSTLGSFLRSFTFRHVRQLDADYDGWEAQSTTSRRGWPSRATGRAGAGVRVSHLRRIQLRRRGDPQRERWNEHALSLNSVHLLCWSHITRLSSARRSLFPPTCRGAPCS